MFRRPRLRSSIVPAAVTIAVFGSCSPHEDRIDRARSASEAEAAAQPPAGRKPAAQTGGEVTRRNAARIVILGDSLTAGLGLPVEQSYPALLQQRLNKEGLRFEIVNAGVS